MEKYYLAIDIGASSGRHIVGYQKDGTLMTDEVYRFPNNVTKANGHLIWDVDAIFENIKLGIREAFSKYPKIESLAIDTWGVDYVLLRGDEELRPVYAYRDSRTERSIPEVHKKVPFAELYRRTGIQFSSFNTVYQLYEDLMAGRLNEVSDFLMLPEYFSYRLTGVKKKEYTDATTTGLVDAKTGEFDHELCTLLGLPACLFEKKLAAPGTQVGELKDEIARFVGGNTKVVLAPSHDTASAVEGIPMQTSAPYISSGTWSLLGVKSPLAITTEKSRLANFSNEGGVGYIRYQKNIMGLWIVQSLRRELCPDCDFGVIAEEARKSRFEGIFDVNDESFLAPESMKGAIDAYFSDKEDKPCSDSDYFNSAYRSLAVSYREALRELGTVMGQTYDTIYIVGGGAKNTYLNELTEKLAGVRVIALPIEATALGNLKTQMKNN